jgi:Ser/Thr protein kinase RdoA (MazF antagonist)
MDALEGVGLYGDGRLLQLNSYENRVFQVHLEDGRVVVAKFYRPGRWSDAQILEEHAFALELDNDEVPVAAPLCLPISGDTLAHATFDGVDYRFCVTERRAGRAPELDNPQTLEWLGRFIGRLHATSKRHRFEYRRTLNVETFGHQPRAALLNGNFIPDEQRGRWQSAADAALARVAAAFNACPTVGWLRLHGDCHTGNILWRDNEGPHFVDLDDACSGPAIQDLWMLLSGDSASMEQQLAVVLAGYHSFMDFDRRELTLIEPLRTLRMIHHSAWLAERWSDPAFPKAFPWFGTTSYWAEQASQLLEQCAAMDEPPPQP